MYLFDFSSALFLPHTNKIFHPGKVYAPYTTGAYFFIILVSVRS